MAALDVGMFSVTVLLPGPDRKPLQHELFDDRAQALGEVGWVALEAPAGSQIVVRDPEGNDILRLERQV